MSKTARWIMYPMLAVVIAFFVWVQFVYAPAKEAERLEATQNGEQVEQAETTDVEVQVQTNDSK